MMQLLEKLPGITVERYTLMERSYTFHAGDNRRSKPVPPSQSKPRANSAKRERNRELQRETAIEMPVRIKPAPVHQPRPSSKRTIRTEFEVYGNRLQDPTKAKDENDNLKTEMTQMPKSILKRTGSGVSTRSSRSIGVLSLDSGMAKLAASLFNNRKSNDVKGNGDVTRTSEKRTTRAKKGQLGNSTDPNSLPAVGGKRGSNLTEGKPPIGNNPRQIVTSPSKSVSFKLEPETHEDDIIVTKKGGARWGVAFSTNQERKNFYAQERLNYPSDGRSSGRSYDKTKGQTQYKLERPPTEAHPSTALLRPRADGGITGVSGIHLMADPYRRYLMARAIDQSQRFAVRENPKLAETKEMRKATKISAHIEPSISGDSGLGIRRSYAQTLPSIKHGR
nr:uncharacterized protein LOC100175899 [Ciona intestinalis]|eukprot:XP_002122404.2 uncharacterized protein LOC100175899 [Ciona intestinalis]